MIPGQRAIGDDGREGLERACALAACGRLFVAKRRDAAYCCPACRQRAYRERQGVPQGTGRHHFPYRHVRRDA